MVWSGSPTPKRALSPGIEADDGEGWPAQGEEAVPDAHPVAPEQFLPLAGRGDLRISPGCHVLHLIAVRESRAALSLPSTVRHRGVAGSAVSAVVAAVPRARPQRRVGQIRAENRAAGPVAGIRLFAAHPCDEGCAFGALSLPPLKCL